MSDDRNLVAILISEGLSHQGLISPTHQQLVAALNHSLSETKQTIHLHDQMSPERAERIEQLRASHVLYLDANGLPHDSVIDGRRESNAERRARKSVPLSEEDKARARDNHDTFRRVPDPFEGAQDR